MFTKKVIFMNKNNNNNSLKITFLESKIDSGFFLSFHRILTVKLKKV